MISDPHVRRTQFRDNESSQARPAAELKYVLAADVLGSFPDEIAGQCLNQWKRTATDEDGAY